LDFSAESANYEKNLEILQNKLSNIEKEQSTMKEMRRIRKPFAILVAVVALMVMSVATLAASPALRNMALSAVQLEDGTVIVSGILEIDASEGSISTIRARMSESEDGTLVIEHECGTQELLNIYSAADLCPDDELLNASFSGNIRDHAPGLEIMKVYASNACDTVVSNMTDAGYSIIQVAPYTVFYRMTDDYGIINGEAVVEASGAVYFVAECGTREFMFQS
ncbi:MAG: hypothetical protein FWE42_09630, partial [Defluviitaleaceae bacterium]|nr:hypothetical protein [Defluviitaleaceae bacterium]